MDLLRTPDTATLPAGNNTPGSPVLNGLLVDGTSPASASKNYAKYYNMTLVELINVIQKAGIVPDSENWHQLEEAIKILGASGLSSTANGKGDELVTVVQPFAGSVARTQHDKNAGYISPQDAGAPDDFTGDALAAINAVIISSGESDSRFDGEYGSFLVSANPTNPLGKRFDNARILKAATQGGYVQLNSRHDENKIIIGKEYMYRFWDRIEAFGPSIKMFLYGDSTVATAANGGGYAGVKFEPQNLLKTYLKNKGILIPVDITNRAVGGTSMYQMNAMPDLDQIGGTTDLFIIKYGINDAGRGLTQFAADMSTKLSEIRSNAFGAVNNLTIVLMMPSSTYDPEHGRSSAWYEQLRGIYVQASRDFECVLFDTYAHLRDVEFAAGYMMDDPFGNGQGVHPTSIMQNQIWAGLVDNLVSESELVPYYDFGVEKPIAFNVTSGWVNYGAPYANFSYSLSRDGNVTIRGTIKSGSIADGTEIGVVPLLPKYTETFVCPTQSGNCQIRVDTSGSIQLADGNADVDYTFLSGVVYKVME